MSDEVEGRLRFMNFEARQRDLLRGLKTTVERLIGPALDVFYNKLRSTPELGHFFRDQAHMSTAKAAQARHWSRITEVRFDASFGDGVRQIGAVHARIGLEPRWYIGAYALVLDNLLESIGKEDRWWRRFGRKSNGAPVMDCARALVKAALLDMELSTSIYVEQSQKARDAAIATLTTSLSKLSAGDVTSEISAMPEGFTEIEAHYNEAVRHLRDLITAVISSAGQLRTGSTEIAQASEDLARRTEGNAASLEQTAAGVQQMDGRLKATASAAFKTVKRANQTKETVESGRSVVDEAMKLMGRVNESAKGIDSVIEGLDKIAFQTRVLAMNAAVEAGRAGETGRGLAVVADLVSALAMRAEEEAKRARDELTVTQGDVVNAVGAVEKIDGALQNISTDVEQVHSLLATIADDNQAQAGAITEINAAVASMDQATQQNAAMVEETSAAARNLLSEVNALTAQAGKFSTGSKGQGTPKTPRAGKEGAYQSPVKALSGGAIAALTPPPSPDDWRDF